MATFADIGKGAKDVLTGHVYDQKLTFARKVQGVPVTGNIIYKADGSVSYDGKGSYTVSGVAVDATINSAGKANVTATKAEVIKGLKVSATSAVYPQFSGAKATATYVVVPTATGGKTLTTKVDVGLTAAPKVESSVAYVHGAVTAGAEVEYDTAKRTVGKYTVGAQYVAKDATVALILADKFDTVKASCVYKVSPTTTAAVEAVHKVAKADTSFTVGALHKIAKGPALKATFSSSGIISSSVSHEIQPNVTGSASVEYNASKKGQSPKFGFQVNSK